MNALTLIRTFLLVTVCLFSVSENSLAKFVGPETVLVTTYGSGDGQVALEYGDTTPVLYPVNFAVSPSGRIALYDEWNARVIIFDQNGNVERHLDIHGGVMAFDSEESLYLNTQFTKIGKEGNIIRLRNVPFDLIRINKEDKIAINKVDYETDNEISQLYDINQNLIKEGDEVDYYFGIIETEKISTNINKSTITYPDKIYKITTDYRGFSDYRDENDFLYIDAGGQVEKFGPCGRSLGKLLLPGGQMFKSETPRAPGVDPYVFIHSEIGSAEFDIHGNIYVYKYTPSKYSILKWTWVDDPSDPKPGPDTPGNFQVIPATQGIYVTWDLSPQDPGCVDTYQIERATSADGIYTTIATVDKGEQSFNDANALQGQSYYYRLRAVADDLYSDFTNAMSGKWTGQ